MKLSKFAFLAAIVMTIFGGQIKAEELQQPTLPPVAYTLQDDAGDSFKVFKNDGEGLEVSGWIQLGYHDKSTGLFN